MTTQDLFRHLIETKVYSPLEEYSHYYSEEGCRNMCDSLNSDIEFDIEFDMAEALKEIQEYMASKGVDNIKRQMIETMLNDEEKEEWSSVSDKLYAKYEKELINLYWNWDNRFNTGGNNNDI